MGIGSLIVPKRKKNVQRRDMTCPQIAKLVSGGDDVVGEGGRSEPKSWLQ